VCSYKLSNQQFLASDFQPSLQLLALVGESLTALVLLCNGLEPVLIEAEVQLRWLEQASPPLAGASLLALVCVKATAYATLLSSSTLCPN
jgi:hypothetical protein